MDHLQVTARLRIHPNKLHSFKEISAQLLPAVRANEPGALQYDWFFNADESECIVRERYSDSNAVFAHLANVGALLVKMLEVSDMSLEIFGNPSEELTTALAAMNPVIYSFYQGL